MKKAFCGGLAVVLIAAFFCMPTFAQTGCKGMMQWSQVGIPSPAYNACASEMKTTLAYNVYYGEGGYLGLHCIVINSGWDRYYGPFEFPPGDGQVTDNWHCTNLKNHQLLIDFAGGIEWGRKIIPYYLKAEYFEDNPQNPTP